MSRRYKIILVAGFCIFVTASAIIAYAKREPIHNDMRTLVEKIDVCVDDSEFSCSRPIVAELLAATSSGSIMDVLALEVSAKKCHDIGHIIGQQAYSKFNDVELAIQDCSRSCAHACIHGITGKAFTETLGLDIDLDPQHLNADDLRRVGTSLCTKMSTCHGVGHALFQTYNELSAPVDACRDISQGTIRQACFTGVFMEHGSRTSSHDNLRTEDRNRFEDPSDILYPCTTVDADARHACLRYQGIVQDTMFKALGIDAETGLSMQKNACESFSDLKDRSSCFDGLGYRLFSLLISTPPAALSYCNQFELAMDRASCISGMVSYVTETGKMLEMVSFCDTVTGAYEQNICYQSIFSVLEYRGAPTPERERLCIDHSLRSETCLRALASFADKPWLYISGIAQ